MYSIPPTCSHQNRGVLPEDWLTDPHECLHQFFGAYLHQDFADDYEGSVEEKILQALDDAAHGGDGDYASTEIDAILAAELSESELKELLEHFCPDVVLDGLCPTNRQIFERVLEIIDGAKGNGE